MYCGKCGQLNADDASFCTTCGSALKRIGVPGGVATTPDLDSVAPAGTGPTQSPPPLRTDGFDAEAWSAAIGPRNTAYYLTRFEERFSSGKRARWHWPAFFVTTYWLFYRKLWGWALLYFFAPYVMASALAMVIAASTTPNGSVAGFLWLVYFAAILFAPPLLANSLYYARCLKILERNKSAVSRERYLAQVEASGGTSNVVAIVIAILAIAFIIGTLAAIALPAYQDYRKRAQTVQAIVNGDASDRKD